MKKIILSTLTVILFSISSNAQVGIRVGVNMANEISKLDSKEISNAFKDENLTAYKIGLVFQSNARKNGIGLESGIFYSQSGASFTPSIMENSNNFILESYKKTNNIEVPLNIRLRIGNKYIGGFATAGIYGNYILNGKYYVKNEQEELSEEIQYENFEERFDYGYALGVGIDAFEKLQLGISWSHGLQKKDTKEKIFDIEKKQIINIEKKVTPRVFSVHLSYIF